MIQGDPKLQGAHLLLDLPLCNPRLGFSALSCDVNRKTTDMTFDRKSPNGFYDIDLNMPFGIAFVMDLLHVVAGLSNMEVHLMELSNGREKHTVKLHKISHPKRLTQVNMSSLLSTILCLISSLPFRLFFHALSFFPAHREFPS